MTDLTDIQGDLFDQIERLPMNSPEIVEARKALRHSICERTVYAVSVQSAGFGLRRVLEFERGHLFCVKLVKPHCDIRCREYGREPARYPGRRQTNRPGAGE